MQQDQAGRDVRPVGITGGNKFFFIEAVFFRRVLYELRQLVGAKDEVLHVEDALGETPEEARRAVLRDLAPGAKNGGAGRKLLP